jgi:hypothetical protein
MSQVIRVVYSGKDKSRLSFGIMFPYEADDWNIAGKESFPYNRQGREDAVEYGRELAKITILN